MQAVQFLRSNEWEYKSNENNEREEDLLMKALQFANTGALANLQVVDLPIPEPGDDEVRVQITAAGLNPSDLKNVLGRFPYTTVPRIPGRDFAGIVEAGPAAWLGKEVWGSGKGIGFARDGSHAEYLCLPVTALAEKPSCLSFAQAAACGVPWITALEAVERAKIEKDTAVVIIGAAGAVGQAAVLLAQARGANVLGVVRREAQQKQLPAGVTPLHLSEPSELTDAVHPHFPQGADVIMDTTGFWLSGAVSVVANYGRIVVISAPAEGKTLFPVLDFYRRGANLIGINSLLHDSTRCAEMLARLGEHFEQQSLPLPVEPRQWSLSEGIAAYQAMESGGAGKIVLIP